MNFNRFCVLGVLIIILLVEKHDTCSSDHDCPVPATCRPNGCKGFNCLCPPGTVVDETLTFCQNASQIGSRCDNNTRCLSKMAICESNVCRCADFFGTTRTLQCSFRDERLIGENCSRSSECADSQSMCQSGTCVCAQGFREKTEDEYWTDPLSRTQCVSLNFSLDYCGFERLVLPMEIIPSSPVTDIEETLPIRNENYSYPEMSPSDIYIEPDANFSDTLINSMNDTGMPFATLLPSETIYIPPRDTVMLSETLLENTVQVNPLIPSEFLQTIDVSSTTLGDPVTDKASDNIDDVTSEEPLVIDVTESDMFETQMVTASFDSIFFNEDEFSRQTLKTDEVFEHTETEDIAPTERTTEIIIAPTETFTDADNTSPGKDTSGNNKTDGNKENSYNSNVVITEEDVKIIISLLGSGVGILVVLTIILVLFKLCRTGTKMSNAVSPEPQDNTSVLKSVNRQRTLFKERW